ncbi:unnamed protein product [Acanthosepion pharaonis]|uniref:Uncharacterized protein n=1 Tax=Acanthosepion pharaonis TaxID=158019 RepID=A0A812C5L4_ACAPH|nr:unnamed protein product [Sepia pharaonis]
MAFSALLQPRLFLFSPLFPLTNVGASSPFLPLDTFAAPVKSPPVVPHVTPPPAAAAATPVIPPPVGASSAGYSVAADASRISAPVLSVQVAVPVSFQGMLLRDDRQRARRPSTTFKIHENQINFYKIQSSRSLSLSLSLFLSVCLSIYLSIYLSVCV